MTPKAHRNSKQKNGLDLPYRLAGLRTCSLNPNPAWLRSLQSLHWLHLLHSECALNGRTCYPHTARIGWNISEMVPCCLECSVWLGFKSLDGRHGDTRISFLSHSIILSPSLRQAGIVSHFKESIRGNLFSVTQRLFSLVLRFFSSSLPSSFAIHFRESGSFLPSNAHTDFLEERHPHTHMALLWIFVALGYILLYAFAATQTQESPTFVLNRITT